MQHNFIVQDKRRKCQRCGLFQWQSGYGVTWQPDKKTNLECNIMADVNDEPLFIEGYLTDMARKSKQVP